MNQKVPPSPNYVVPYDMPAKKNIILNFFVVD
jgi:hypothetical protein